MALGAGRGGAAAVLSQRRGDQETTQTPSCPSFPAPRLTSRRPRPCDRLTRAYLLSSSAWQIRLSRRVESKIHPCSMHPSPTSRGLCLLLVVLLVADQSGETVSDRIDVLTRPILGDIYFAWQRGAARRAPRYAAAAVQMMKIRHISRRTAPAAGAAPCQSGAGRGGECRRVP